MSNHQNISINQVSLQPTWEKALTMVGLLLQAVLLAFWEQHQGVSHVTGVIVGFCLVGMVFWVTMPRRFLHHLNMAAVGGAGMAFGTWADWGFGTPACLCCIYQGQREIWLIWATTMLSCSVLCMLTWPVLYGLLPQKFSQHTRPTTHRIVTYATSSFGMLIGMLIAAWLGSYVVRQLHHSKLLVGHSFMVLGMLIGCELALLVQQKWLFSKFENSPHHF